MVRANAAIIAKDIEREIAQGNMEKAKVLIKKFQVDFKDVKDRYNLNKKFTEAMDKIMNENYLYD